MKILHTSDWHLGHTLYNYDRTEEQRAMLDEITDVVRERKPDVFVLSGDVYHTSQPSAAVQKLFTEALVGIRDANPGMTIVVTAGNHDSGSKHEVFRTPWRALGVHAIGRLDKENIDDHIVEVAGKGYVVAVPYCNEKSIPEDFFQKLLDEVKQRNTEGRPVVLTAHTTVKGCDFSGHENASDYMVGGIDSMEVSQFGSGYDYLALGHIHHEQYVHTGHHNVRYSGSPMAVSFDENFKHSVSVVEIGKHGDKHAMACARSACDRPTGQGKY
ncbi:MAG: exonuclease SbcCD subunit D [Muribaculaceae bacterium]|nr:exonuclease SbcCD subunit D [Muribaculaceae bacterium]